MKSAFILLAACGVFVGCGANVTDSGPETKSTNSALTVSGNHVTGFIQQQGSFDLDANFDCGNAGGEFTFTGAVLFDNVLVDVIAQNNKKGTHSDNNESRISLELRSESGFNAMPGWGRGGVGGNPWILFQPADENGKGVSDAVVLGRCKGKSAKHHFDLTGLLASVDFTGKADGCDKTGGPGPQVTLEGVIASGALKGKVWFVNSVNSPNPHVVEWKNPDLMLDVILSQKVSFNVSNRFGDGVGGNPLIYIQAPPDPKDLLGRCNQL